MPLVDLPRPASIGLDAMQAVLVLLPAAHALPRWLPRPRSALWALTLPVSIVACVVGISFVPGTADVLAWLSLIALPLLAALGLGIAGIHGARPPLALIAVALLVVAIVADEGLVSDLSAGVLTTLSAATLAWLLVSVAPHAPVKAALVLMACIDAYLVFSNELAAPNAVLNGAVVAPTLPQLQRIALDGAQMGYGDLFVAAVFGALLAAEGRPQLRWAIAAFVVGAIFDLLFTWFDTLPATVPIALLVIASEVTRRRRGRTAEPALGPPRPVASSA